MPEQREYLYSFSLLNGDRVTQGTFVRVSFYNFPHRVESIWLNRSGQVMASARRWVADLQDRPMYPDYARDGAQAYLDFRVEDCIGIWREREPLCGHVAFPRCSCVPPEDEEGD